MRREINLGEIKRAGITVKSTEAHPERQAHISAPLPITVTLLRERVEMSVEVWERVEDRPTTTVNGKAFPRVLSENDYLRLVLNRYRETEEDMMKRSWQYKKWGEPVYRLSPKLARVGHGWRIDNEFDYYHYDPGWYEHNISKPFKSFKQRFEEFVFARFVYTQEGA